MANMMGKPAIEALWKRAKSGDPAARNQLIEDNMGLVWAAAKRLPARENLEDLVQVGSIGLIKAVDRFDPAQGCEFSSYAYPVIIGEIKRYLRDHGPVKIARSAQALARRAWQCAKALAGELGREPTVSEIADALQESVTDIAEACEASLPPVPLETRPDLARSQDDDLQSLELKDAIESLGPRERIAVLLRYAQGKTQMEISGILGCSQAQVSRLEKKALERLRERLS